MSMNVIRPLILILLCCRRDVWAKKKRNDSKIGKSGDSKRHYKLTTPELPPPLCDEGADDTGEYGGAEHYSNHSKSSGKGKRRFRRLGGSSSISTSSKGKASSSSKSKGSTSSSQSKGGTTSSHVDCIPSHDETRVPNHNSNVPSHSNSVPSHSNSVPSHNYSGKGKSNGSKRGSSKSNMGTGNHSPPVNYSSKGKGVVKKKSKGKESDKDDHIIDDGDYDSEDYDDHDDEEHNSDDPTEFPPPPGSGDTFPTEPPSYITTDDKGDGDGDGADGDNGDGGDDGDGDNGDGGDGDIGDGGDVDNGDGGDVDNGDGGDVDNGDGGDVDNGDGGDVDNGDGGDGDNGDGGDGDNGDGGDGEDGGGVDDPLSTTSCETENGDYGLQTGDPFIATFNYEIETLPVTDTELYQVILPPLETAFGNHLLSYLFEQDCQVSTQFRSRSLSSPQFKDTNVHQAELQYNNTSYQHQQRRRLQIVTGMSARPLDAIETDLNCGFQLDPGNSCFVMLGQLTIFRADERVRRALQAEVGHQQIIRNAMLEGMSAGKFDDSQELIERVSYVDFSAESNPIDMNNGGTNNNNDNNNNGGDNTGGGLGNNGDNGSAGARGIDGPESENSGDSGINKALVGSLVGVGAVMLLFLCALLLQRRRENQSEQRSLVQENAERDAESE